MTPTIASADGCCNWMQLDAGADAAEDVLALVFGRRVQKGWLDPLTRTGYARILRNLMRDMLTATAGPERAALQAAIKQVDVDWPSMTAAQQQRRITAVASVFGKLPNFIIPRVQRVMGVSGRAIVTDTKKALSKKHRGISASFTSIDQRVIDHARSSQALFIRNQYGQRMESLSAKARDIVANGVAQGLDRYDIAEDLAWELNAMVPRRQAYWQVVASIFAARSRTYGTLAGFSDAGIEQYEWSSVLDEVTSDVCRFMDGRVFSTSAAVDRFADVANSKDPEAVVGLQPFVQVGRDRNGDKGLYYKQGEDRVPVARIERSGLGNRNDRGEFAGAMSRGKMEAAGISAPPAHGHCRSLLVAHFTSVQVPSMVSDPSGEQRVPQGPGAKPQSKPAKPQGKPKPAKPQQPKPSQPKPLAAPPAPSPTKPKPGDGQPIVPPKPAPTKPTEGVHFEKLVSKLSQADTDEALSIIDKTGLLKFLEKNPLRGIALAPLPENINGAYLSPPMSKGMLFVHSERAQSHGEPFVPGKSWSVSQAGATPMAAMQRTLVHEFGHHVHFSSTMEVDVVVREAFAKSKSSTTDQSRAQITEYAEQDHNEYFAESFAAYIFNNDDLRLHDPNGFAMVKRVRGMVGLPE